MNELYASTQKRMADDTFDKGELKAALDRGAMSTNRKIEVLSTAVTVYHYQEDDFISLTDIARHRDAARGDYIIQNWLRNRNTIEFLGIWEQLNNPEFNSIEFDGIKNQSGLNSFSLTPKRWTTQTGAIGIISKTGRYGGTFAHKDIAFEFASWVSVEFKLYLGSASTKIDRMLYSSKSVSQII